MKTARYFDPIAFRSAATAAKLSTERLALRVGVSASYIAHVRCGLVPSEGVRERIAAVLGVEASRLWPTVEAPDAPPPAPSSEAA